MTCLMKIEILDEEFFDKNGPEVFVGVTSLKKLFRISLRYLNVLV